MPAQGLQAFSCKSALKRMNETPLKSLSGFAVTSFQGNGSDAAQTFADMGTLDGVKKLFANDDVILPAWVHYLAFDLIVGNHLVERNLA